MSINATEQEDAAVIHAENPTARAITYYQESERADFERIRQKVIEQKKGRVIGNVIEEIGKNITTIHEWIGPRDASRHAFNADERTS